MPNLSDLPYEIRLLIWEALLHQPRTVYLNMREFPPKEPDADAYVCGGYNQESVYQCLCSTPAPILLHICHETRALALGHYELAFGWAHCPPLRQAGVVLHHGFSAKGQEYPTTTIESNAAEVAKHCAKVYFNFDHDTVVFGRFLPSSSSSNGVSRRAYFPFGEQFDVAMLARIRNLAVNIDIASSVLPFLNLSPGSERFSSLRNLYVYIESDDPGRRPRRVVELVDLTEDREVEDGRRDLTQRLLERFKNVFGRRGVTVALKTICKDGLGFWRYLGLRDSLLKNGGDPDKLLKCVWLREMDTT
ncbi:uncharacterized protein BHQ10_002263 [Talaromyces amestolkiae]|uniref:2EXR domain-containing protein n=1 Tax=Talaromyces amestolkiae TaxID=1196081 RepID=A0A364KRX0_TALAM|nr:uncharacterized protein BHQ10_002263 [Talaromyces amestolkiae]RAO66251.1 hypothetical protein BHQ10_002263 [Talaromyces amestolkiae]